MADSSNEVELMFRRTLQVEHPEGIEQVSTWLYTVGEDGYGFTASTTFDMEEPLMEKHVPPSVVDKAIDTAIDGRVVAEQKRKTGLKLAGIFGGAGFTITEVSDLATSSKHDYVATAEQTGENILFGAVLFFYGALLFAKGHRKQRDSFDRQLVGLNMLKKFVAERQSS